MKKINIYFMLLGVGVGALISGLALKVYPVPKVEITDQEVIERAKDLGMVGMKEHIEKSSAQKELEAEAVDEQPLPIEASIAVTQGEGSEAVADKLLSAKLIEDKNDFILFVSEKKAGRSFRQGTYTIKSGSSYDEILSILTKGVYRYDQ